MWGVGGYERLIGIVKNSLKKILGRARPTYDEIIPLFVKLKIF